MKEKLVKEVTSRDTDFAQWYTDLCLKAELMDYTSAKGFIIYRPYGYALWEGIKEYLDKKFKETNHENVYMPVLIPESLFQKEKDHIEGFAPETAIVTKGGKDDLEENLIVRPTSEVLFCDHYSKIISSHRDLPKLYNQWCSVLRWEKTTRPFLRGKEFLWQEGHTVHKTEEEAIKEALDILEIYKEMGKELLAIPFITGQKTEKEKFAGAKTTYTLEALMHDGKALQCGTTHNFSDGFAKAFNITYQDVDNKIKYPFQTSWGVSTRLLGAIIMVHGDNEGLVLPPRIAPKQVVIIPITNKEIVKEKTEELYNKLKNKVRVFIDDSNKSPGWKFSEHELKGVPIRVEIGPRDLENNNVTLVLRHTREKIVINIDEVEFRIEEILDKIHNEMYDKAVENVQLNTREAKTYEEFKEIISTKGGYVKMMWSGDQNTEIKIKEDTQATSRCIPFIQEKITEIDPVDKKEAKYMVLYAKAY